MVVEKINERLYDLFIDELNELELGHGYNYKRLSYMRAMITMLLYLRYTVLNNNEILRILAYYEHL